MYCNEQMESLSDVNLLEHMSSRKFQISSLFNFHGIQHNEVISMFVL